MSAGSLAGPSREVAALNRRRVAVDAMIPAGRHISLAVCAHGIAITAALTAQAPTLAATQAKCVEKGSFPAEIIRIALCNAPESFSVQHFPDCRCHGAAPIQLGKKAAVIGKIRYAYLAMTGRYNDLDRRPAIANGSCELQAVNAARHIDISEDHLNSWVGCHNINGFSGISSL